MQQKIDNARATIAEIIRQEGRTAAHTTIPQRPTGIGLETNFVRPAAVESTGDVPENAVNLYFTTARAYAAAKAMLQEGTGITIVADDEHLTITISADGGGLDPAPADDALLFGRTDGNHTWGSVLFDTSGNPISAGGAFVYV